MKVFSLSFVIEFSISYYVLKKTGFNRLFHKQILTKRNEKVDI